MSTHRFVAHTSEVQIELEAPTLSALFEEAGRALGEVLLGTLPSPPTEAQALHLWVEAKDAEALLVRWLDELIFQSERSKQVFTRIRVEHVGEWNLRATVWGLRPKTLKTAVKAATFHEVNVRCEHAGWQARVLLDV